MKPGLVILILILIDSIKGTCGQFTMKGGVTKAHVTFSDTYAQTFSPIKGVTFGIGYNFQIDSSTFSIQPELNFIQKGSDDRYFTQGTLNTSLESETTAKINYLEIPVLARCTFGVENFRAYLNAGFSLAVGVGGKYDNITTQINLGTPSTTEKHGAIKFGEPSGTSTQDLYIDNRVDIGFQSGAGIILFKFVVLDFRYGLGLTNLYDPDVDDPNSNPSSKNRVLQFTFGLTFPPKETK